MDYSELKHKSEKELHDLLNGERVALRGFRFKAHDQQLKDVRSIRETRKNIARILTAMKAFRVSHQA